MLKKIFIPLCIVLLLAGCSTSTYNLNFKSSPNLNPDIQNQSLPVEVKVFQLSSKSAFANASFRDLWLSDKATLGNSLLHKKEIIMNPDSQKEVPLDIDKKAKFVGVVAIYRNPQGDQWRLLKKLSSDNSFFSRGISVKLSGNTIHF